MNHYNPNIHHRHSIRLKGYDYSKAGLYYITICVHDRECLFGKIENKKMVLNDAGMMVENEWLNIPGRFPNVQLHQYVIMPNHFHAIMEITVGATLVVAPTAPVAQNAPVANAPVANAPVANAPVANALVANVPVANAPVANVQVANAPVAQNVPENQNAPVAQNDADPENDGEPKRATTRVAPTVAPTVGGIVGAFQSIVTVNYIRGVKNQKWPSFNGKLWQRNYWEHIIRSENSYRRISDYILNNPENWYKDKFKH